LFPHRKGTASLIRLLGEKVMASSTKDAPGGTGGEKMSCVYGGRGNNKRTPICIDCKTQGEKNFAAALNREVANHRRRRENQEINNVAKKTQQGRRKGWGTTKNDVLVSFL